MIRRLLCVVLLAVPATFALGDTPAGKPHHRDHPSPPSSSRRWIPEFDPAAAGAAAAILAAGVVLVSRRRSR